MMNNLILLLKHDLILVKNRIYVYILFFLLPVLFILFFSIPLSFVFTDIKPIYLVWSTTGVSTISTIIFSSVLLLEVFLNRQDSQFIFSVPIKVSNYISSIYFFAFFMALFEFSFSIFLINSLNNYFLTFTECFIIFLLLIPAILIVSSITIILGCYTKESISFIIYIFSLFIVCSFGLGAFFPLNIYPDIYMGFIQFYPVSCTIFNIHRVIAADSIYFSLLVVSIIYSMFFIFISAIMVNSKIKERLY